MQLHGMIKTAVEEAARLGGDKPTEQVSCACVVNLACCDALIA